MRGRWQMNQRSESIRVIHFMLGRYVRKVTASACTDNESGVFSFASFGGRWTMVRAFIVHRPPSIVHLPNLAALVGGAHHRVADLTLERLGEGGHVRERAVDAEATQRVRVGGDALARGLGADVLRPDLRPPEEESLLGREARDGLRPRLAFQRLPVGGVGDG